MCECVVLLWLTWFRCVRSSRGKQASASASVAAAVAAPSAADGGGGVGRVAALLAAAGPRDQSSRDSSRERRGSNNSSSSGKRDVREAPTGQGSAVEFNRKMSLEPPKDKDKDAAARQANHDFYCSCHVPCVSDPNCEDLLPAQSPPPARLLPRPPLLSEWPPLLPPPPPLPPRWLGRPP